MRVSSPLSKRAKVAIEKAWLIAKMIEKGGNKAAAAKAWLAVIALVPDNYCFHGVQRGVLVFSKAEEQVVSAADWEAHWAKHGRPVSAEPEDDGLAYGAPYPGYCGSYGHGD